MKESQFGFEYSWADLQPVRALAVIVFGAQIAGGLAGLAFPQFPRWFESLWFGAAIATLPAFLIGLAVQSRLRPGSLAENRVMVRRLGLIALFLSAFALAMPLFGFGKYTGAKLRSLQSLSSRAQSCPTSIRSQRYSSP